jgi:lycopene beta-cyclase
MSWHQGTAQRVYHAPDASHLVTSAGETITARVVIDASGHAAALVQRPAPQRVAHQVAFGIIGTFSAPPVRTGQLVLMDFRYDHLPGDAKSALPTFLYAMHLGGDRYFVEETSLASMPPMSFELLEQRLYRRLAARGAMVRTIEHTEHCLFPMNLPLPYLDQPILAYGGAASMVHPASGYQVGAALRQAPRLAAVLAHAAVQPNAGPVALARAGWDALWPGTAVRNRNLYELGLHSLLNFGAADLDEFFGTFFQLPYPAWTGYLSNTLTTPEIVRDMVGLFVKAPNQIRAGLVRSAFREPALLKSIAGL